MVDWRYIDGGFLSYIYGVKPEFLRSWGQMRRHYTRDSGAVILMDAHRNFRHDLLPQYKEHRRDAEKDDALKKWKRDNVVFFRGILEEDPSLATIRIEGYEADDLIGLYSWLQPGKTIQVLGTDKDLWQLPNVHLTNHLGQVTDKTKAIKSFPKGIQSVITSRNKFVLALALYGDASDNVSRIAPKYVTKHIARIMRSKKPWHTFHDALGAALVFNLKLVFLPGFPAFKEDYTDHELINIFEEGAIGDAFTIREDIAETLLPYT